MEIFSGYNTYLLDLKWVHPDHGTNYDTCSVVWDDSYDDLNADDFTKLMLEEIWNKYNYGGYYHELYVSNKVIIDNDVYILSYRYNGVDVDKLKTQVKHICD